MRILATGSLLDRAVEPVNPVETPVPGDPAAHLKQLAARAGRARAAGRSR